MQDETRVEVIQAREFLAAEYDQDSVDHDAKGYSNAASNQRFRAQEIRDGKAELHAVRAITAALAFAAPPAGEREESDACAFCGTPDPLCSVDTREKIHPYRVVCKSCGCGTAYHGDFKAAWASWIRRPASLPHQADREAEEEAAYQLGRTEGRDAAMQEIDQATGGDGEYRYCTIPDEGHCPDADSMKARIVERFAHASLADRDAIAREAFSGHGRMDKEGLDRWRDIAEQTHGHDLMSINANSVRRLIGTIDYLLALSPTPSAGREVNECICPKCGLRHGGTRRPIRGSDDLPLLPSCEFGFYGEADEEGCLAWWSARLAFRLRNGRIDRGSQKFGLRQVAARLIDSLGRALLHEKSQLLFELFWTRHGASFSRF